MGWQNLDGALEAQPHSHSRGRWFDTNYAHQIRPAICTDGGSFSFARCEENVYCP